MPFNIRRYKIIPFLVCVILLFAAIYSMQGTIDRSYQKREEEGLLYLPTGKFLKPLCLGFESLAADLLWLKAIGYFGGHYITDRGYKWLYHILDLVTTLDPYFRYPYEFGGIVLSLEAGDPEKGTALMEKGLQYHQDYWRLYFYVGFNYFYYFRDPKKGAYYLTKAASLPDHPPYVPKLAASLLAESEGKGAALSFLRQLYENTDDRWLKQQIEKKMQELLDDKMPDTLKGLLRK